MKLRLVSISPARRAAQGVQTRPGGCYRECMLVSLATAGAGPCYSKRGYETRASYYKKYLSRAEQAVAVDRREDEAPAEW